LAALLRSLSALDIYSYKYGIIRVDKVIHLLFCDQLFPRSVMFCMTKSLSALKKLDGKMKSSYDKAMELCSNLEKQSGSKIIEYGLHEYINDLQVEMNELSLQIGMDYFSY
jgi:uncharacterized alpha-E superfamily protein